MKLTRVLAETNWVDSPHPDKEWTGGFMKKDRYHDAIHAHRGADGGVATMNQVVYGNPPLSTIGVNGCSVFAGMFADGTGFLGHFDPIETRFSAWTTLLIRGRGQDLRKPPYTPAVSLVVLCPENKRAGIEQTLAMWGDVERYPTHNLSMLKSVKIHTYTTTSGMTVEFDGRDLTWWEEKP